MWLILGITFFAAAVQTVRFMLQKQLAGGGLSTGGATFSRFLFASPLALGLAVVVAVWQDIRPDFSLVFWGYVVLGGIGQIVATFCTVALFKERNFAVGIGFTKTETMMVALFSALILGEPVSKLGLLGIIIGVVGVLCLTRAKGAGAPRLFNYATLLGVMAGAFFAIASIAYRGAILELTTGDFFFRAIITLAAVTTFQTLIMAVWLLRVEPGELGRVALAWRRTLPVGITGMLGSLGWFTAFALFNAAYVRAIGQIEIVFTILASWLVFRERLTLREGFGIFLVVASLLLIVWSLEG